MIRRIYWILFWTAILSGILLYLFKGYLGVNALLTWMFTLSMVWVASIHGIMVHTVKAEVKGGMIVYPVIMGTVFGVILFLFAYLIMPFYCTSF